MAKPILSVAWIGLVVLLGCTVSSAFAAERPANKQARPTPAFPLKVAESGRCLVDQNGVPFMIYGESPQALMVNLSEKDAELFFANRQGHGFNAVWINLLCRPGTGGRPNGSTYDGLLPFEKPDDFSTPNEAYFARCDRMIRLAEQHGLLVILDPCETIDHLKLMLKNGPKACGKFGRYLGDRYKHFDNLLWLHGNDFQTWKDADHDAVALALAEGIKDADPRHLHTIELNYLVSSSHDDARWAPIINLTRRVHLLRALRASAKGLQPPTRPACGHDRIRLRVRAKQHAGGAAASRVLVPPQRGGGPTVRQRLHLAVQAWLEREARHSRREPDGLRTRLFRPAHWHRLVPDQKHTVVNAGYGTFDAAPTEGNLKVMTSDYVTAARTPDGTLVMAYLPSRRTVNVNMAELGGPATARWYDPSRGVYTAIKGSPLPNAGNRAFTPPGNNGDGDGDWVLVLETTPPKEDRRP